MRILSILMMVVLCQGGFGQSVLKEEFRLDRQYQNHEIVQDEKPKPEIITLQKTGSFCLAENRTFSCCVDIVPRYN